MKAAAGRTLADLVLILIGVSLLITPVPPTTARRELPPPRGVPSVPAASVERKAVDGDQAGESTELPPRTPPEPVAPPAAAPVLPRAQRSIPAGGPTYAVRIGPISEANAGEIIRRLAAAHYSVKNAAASTEPERFRVVSAAMSRPDALQLAADLSPRGIPSFVRSLTGDQVELQFGVFTIEHNAEDLVDRVRERGYSATVVREGAIPIIAGGPYSAASVRAIIKTIESSMSDRPLTTVPCGAKEPRSHAWRGWVEVCRTPPSDR